VRDLSRAQRIVPVVGDFAGPSALRAIGAWARERGLTVSAFYLSNVEFYLMRNHVFDRFVANVRELPSRPESLMIRACFDYGRSHPAELPGHRRRPLELGEPVRQTFGQLVRFRIPAGAHLSIAQAERARQVDHPHAGRDKRRRQFSRSPVGQREKHEVGVAGERLGVERRDRAGKNVGERRQAARRR